MLGISAHWNVGIVYQSKWLIHILIMTLPKGNVFFYFKKGLLRFILVWIGIKGICMSLSVEWTWRWTASRWQMCNTLTVALFSLKLIFFPYWGFYPRGLQWTISLTLFYFLFAKMLLICPGRAQTCYPPALVSHIEYEISYPASDALSSKGGFPTHPAHLESKKNIDSKSLKYIIIGKSMSSL